MRQSNSADRVSRQLSMDARLSISNMTTEWGALVGWFPVDEVTIRYLKDVNERLAAQGVERFTEGDLVRWADESAQAPIRSGLCGENRARSVQVTPHVSGPDTVRIMSSLAEMEAKVAIQKAYLVSCVNSRLKILKPPRKF